MRGTNYRGGLIFGAFWVIGGLVMFRIGQSPSLTKRTGPHSIDDTSNLVFKFIGVCWVAVGLFLVVVFVWLGIRGAARRALAIGGVEGTAIVEKADTTNTFVNGLPVYRLEVELRRSDGGPSLRCTKRDIVPNTSLGRWGIGTALPVRIADDDPDDFEILWDTLRAAGAPLAEVADELAKLAELSKQGLLSPEEWERAKELYLGKPPDRREADVRLLDHLHQLFQEGGLSESEFNSKKWEILSRT